MDKEKLRAELKEIKQRIIEVSEIVFNESDNESIENLEEAIKQIRKASIKLR